MVERFGALELRRGRLWLGRPAAPFWRQAIPLGFPRPTPFGISVGSDGVRCHGASWPGRTRAAWEAMSSVAVTLDPVPEPDPTARKPSLLGRGARAAGFAAVVAAAASLEAPPGTNLPGGPYSVIHLVWTERTRWERYEAGALQNWGGALTELETYALTRLPDALRCSPGLRHTVASEAGTAELLDRLAAASSTAELDTILAG